jgi:hypothetical protein
VTAREIEEEHRNLEIQQAQELSSLFRVRIITNNNNNNNTQK